MQTADRLPSERRNRVRHLTETVAAVGKRIGQVTHLANSMPDPTWDGTSKKNWRRDSEGMRQVRALPQSQRGKLQQPVRTELLHQKPDTQVLDLSSHPR